VRLHLRPGIVLSAGDPARPMQELDVRLGGTRRRALADTALIGPAQPGDEVIVNIANDVDLVHVNLTRGLTGEGDAGAQAIKLHGTSLQHAVQPVEEGAPAEPPSRDSRLPTGAPVAIGLLHAQLPALAWAFHQSAPGARLGYVQTAGGALPGGLSPVVAELRERGLLAAHVTAGPAYGGERDALTTAGALQHGFVAGHWHAAICAPGPGSPGSSTLLGHAGIVALESAHAAAALGCRVIVAPRPRRRGLAHHTQTLLELALTPLIVATASGRDERGPARHEWRPGEADLDGYLASGLPARSLEEDPDFFASALAAGDVLAHVTRAAMV
jgi:hypothetical protein